jgi:hypothetical protein
MPEVTHLDGAAAEIDTEHPSTLRSRGPLHLFGFAALPRSDRPAWFAVDADSVQARFQKNMQQQFFI